MLENGIWVTTNSDPRPGFDHWVSFVGQGVYTDPVLNINGSTNAFTGYNADVLTDQALAWLKEPRKDDKPFFMYLSYKAVHYPFQPAPRHKGKYHGQPMITPKPWPTPKKITKPNQMVT